MAKELTIRVGEEVGAMVLFEDKAPKTCKKILEALPIKSTAIVAKVAGSELMVRTPFFLDTGPENEVQAQKAGNVCYWAFSQNICIFCEDLPGLGKVSLIGKITKNLRGVQKEAEKCRKKQGAVVEIYE